MRGNKISKQNEWPFNNHELWTFSQRVSQLNWWKSISHVSLGEPCHVPNHYVTSRFSPYSLQKDAVTTLKAYDRPYLVSYYMWILELTRDKNVS